MSSSPPQPPPRTQRPLHNFNLASDLMWSTKSRSTRNTTSRHRSSSSSWNASEFGSTNRSPFSFPPQHSLESSSFMQGLYLSPAMNFNDKESGCIDKNTTGGDKQVIFGSEKNVGTSIDQGKPVQENIDKQIKAIGEKSVDTGRYKVEENVRKSSNKAE
ncbi:hypothetical protein ACH5RR_023617 [Cinchona calisaya]|uniref:Uncharacterized protein n=1 Tax=Cinchona calisaya TaxID=153742 RepID=A0ABD2ZEH7_9GENT